MKIRIFTIISLLVYASFAQASKARLEALGQSGNGSLYIKDSRNIFYNPSFVNELGETLFFEWGNNSNVNDTQAAPRADGGYFDKLESLMIGLYLGDEPTGPLRNAFNANYLSQENSVTLFVGGKSSQIVWGGSLLYSSNKDETGIERKENSLIVDLGAQFNDKLNGHFSYSVTDKAEGATFNNDKADFSGAMTLGGTYSLTKAKTLFFQYTQAGGKLDNAGVGANTDIMYLTLGLARQKEISKGFLYYSLAYENSKIDETDADIETDIKNLPIKIGVEKKLKDWLVLRTSITQNVLLSETVTKNAGTKTTESNGNSTQVSAGTGLLLDDNLQLDSSLTTTGGTITTNNMITRVSLVYNL